MGIYKNLNPEDVSLRSFEVHKEFTFTNNDSGSGVFAIKARSGSRFNYVSSSDAVITITSGSVSTNFFGYPTYTMLHNLFYSNHGRNYVRSGSMNRNLHNSASVISVPRELYGEKIKPLSIESVSYTHLTLFHYCSNSWKWFRSRKHILRTRTISIY